MKLVGMEVLIDKGRFSASQEWTRIRGQNEDSIRAIEWPPGSGSFTIYKQSGKKRGEGSGVKPIKEAFVAKLESYGWELEKKLDIATVRTPGRIDATYRIGDKFFAAEWETGNISSSHRALNKMALGIIKGILIGGILILPTRDLYYSTSRIGLGI